ncbi:MAG: uric acid degradation bifunctional protein TTL-like isoform [Flaviaesturariibacter sp.]|nr:uric acid degradation bifunctional protein TTL-like isoform [Flaviaesturariibacter sp.]
MKLEEFNQMERAEAIAAISTCCGSATWAGVMADRRPFGSIGELVTTATDAWYDRCGASDWLEAFTHHPRIGDLDSLRSKFASTSHLAGAEQSGVQEAPAETLEAIARGNASYDERHKFLFIVCATGRSAADMLRLLEDRLENSPSEELSIAMGEQEKITLIRLKKLFAEEDWSGLGKSQLTTHVLDTTLGRPGASLTIRLQENSSREWRTIAQGVTDADGRVADLLPPGRILPAGSYTMAFDTARYYADRNLETFYPTVEIRFTVSGNQHYHVPLLLSPFGYTTYRGS